VSPPDGADALTPPEGADAGRPLVSVVMPFKDAAPFLAEAASSVLAQTCRSLELLLVDDGGSDGSSDIAVGIRRQDPGRVRVLTHPGRVNRGTGPSRALGITSARGELTAFLDADDYWEPGHLEHEIGLLDRHPAAGMVCGRVRTWRSWDDPRAEDRLSGLAFAPRVVVPPPRLLAAVLRNGGVATATCSLLARTTALQRSVEHLRAFPGTYEDQVINTLLQLHVAAVMSGTTTAWYRQHPASISALDAQVAAARGEVSDPGRAAFLDWLSQLPEVAGPDGDTELRELLCVAVERERARRARAGTRAARARAALPGQVVRAVEAAQALTSTMRRRALGGAATGSRAHVGSFLFMWGEEIRGDVLEIGGTSHARRAVGRPVSRVDGHAPDSPPAVIARLRDAATSAYDCVLLLAVPDELDRSLREVRRALRPGGVLLAVMPTAAPGPEAAQLEHAACEVFGAEAVSSRHYGRAGVLARSGPATIAVRAFLPA
jgi:hypothetical protein